MKFQVGDKVVLVKQPESAFENMIGLVGKIVEIDEEWHMPYEVEWDDGKHHDGICLFSDEDLELMTVIDREVKKANTQYYVDIKFQEGAVLENGVNGAQIEDVIDLLIDRLQGFQKGGFPCRENALAITKLEEARMWLNERTRKRKEQGVEGKDEKHV